MIIKGIIFLVLSSCIVYISRASLGNPKSHGYYRFFAWETIAILIVLNLEYWFVDPFSIPQIFSWIFLMISFVLIIHGIYLFQKIGKPDDSRRDSSLMGIEKTTRLVIEGAYKYIRHPFYSSLLFLCWGTLLKSVSLMGLVFGVMATIFLVLTAKVEEREDIQYFGNEYIEYMRRTKMFIPFIF